MKLLIWLCLIVLCMTGVNRAFAQEGSSGFTKKEFYQTMAGKDKVGIDKQLNVLQTASVADKKAYEGALLMKKAGLGGSAKKKLDLFKQGHKKLESALQQDSSNTEYRFLRLMIQEHSPGILGYKANIEADKMYIKNNFKKLQPVVQEAVQQYAKKSRILKPADL